MNHDKKSQAGAKPYDVVMMFKVLLLQRYYNLSDEQVEYQIVDRISFKNFLGLSSGDKVPDARTLVEVPRQRNTMKHTMTTKTTPKAIQKAS